MKRTALRRRSKKTAKLYREERVDLVKKLIEEHPICQRCEKDWSVTVHEILTRARGGSITDEENCRALCDDCHREIHSHPARSLAEGWLISRWKRD